MSIVVSVSLESKLELLQVVKQLKFFLYGLTVEGLPFMA